MRHDEDRPLGPRENLLVAAHVAEDGAAAALASPRRLQRRLVRRRPGAIVGERAAFEPAEAHVVQLREDESRDLAADEREVGRPAGALELAGHAEVDPRLRQLLAAPARLLLARLRERTGDGRVPVDRA